MKTNYLVLLIGLIFYLTACTEKIDFDLNDDNFKRVVVEGLITDQVKRHEVRLTYTSSYYANEQAEAVSGAVVSITDGQSTWPLTENPSGSGYYYTESDVAGTVGLNHTLSIVHDNVTYEASDVLKPVAVLDSIAIEQDFDDDEVIYNILAWTQETPGIGDYYRWRVYVNGVTENDTLDNYAFQDDQVFDGADFVGEEFWELDEDVEVGDTIVMEQMSITEQANDIYIALNLETNWRGGLFDSAPANVQTNLSNGAIGFFGASSVSSRSVIIPE